jgi:uncharacterized protein
MTGQPGQRRIVPPDVRRVLEWRDLDAGVVEAQMRGALVVCLAEPTWSNGAQRLALVLRQEDDTRELCASSFVPVLLDPEERPDLAARLRWASAALTGTIGPPLLVLLTPRGAPFLSYCTLHPELRRAEREPDLHPSLQSLLRSVAPLAEERLTELEEEARRLQARSQPERGGDGAAPPRIGWDTLRHAVDERFGGLLEQPKHPRATLLWGLFGEAGRAPVRAHLLRTLEGMQRGGIRDQLSGSFHRCSRDERWVVPHFEKLVPQNAALAAVYARAGRDFGRPDFLDTARAAASFAAAGLDEETMVIASDTAYYTWTPQAFQEALDPAHVQALGLHFNIAHGDSALVLFQALDIEAMGEYADEPPELLRERVARGKALLALARSQRPPPERHRVDAPAWHAETLRWLFEAARYLPDGGTTPLETSTLDRARLERHLDRVLEGSFDPELGYARAERARGGAYWLQDQAAIAAACIAAGPAMPEAPRTAERLARIIMGAYRPDEWGPLTDTPNGPRASLDVVDHVLSAAVPSVIATLRALAASGGVDGVGAEAERFAAAAERPFNPVP